MKRFFTAILVFICLSSKAQVNGALGVNFGCGSQAVKEMMRTKHPDAKFYEEADGHIAYLEGKWAGYKAYLWIFYFTESDKLHTIVVQAEPDHDDDVFDLYDEIVTSMKEKYGQSKDEFENWTYPYEAKDKRSHGVTALKLGKLNCLTYWKFPSNSPDSEEDDNTILIKIGDNIKVQVKYQDGLLIDEVLEKNKSKNQGDM